MSITGSTGQQGLQGYPGPYGPRGDTGATGWVNTVYTNFFPFNNPTGPRGPVGLIKITATNVSGNLAVTSATAGQIYQISGDVTITSIPYGYFWVFQNTSTTTGYKITISSSVQVLAPGQYATVYNDSSAGINFL